MKRRPDGQDPFVPPPEYGRSLGGMTLNLLVTDMERALLFHRSVLGVEVRYADLDMAVVDGFSTSWMLHADHTYDKHPLLAHAQKVASRGSGAEIRLHGLDPDAAAERATAAGFVVFDGPRDQPDHGLREAHLLDQDGYVWVADVPLA